MKDIKSTLLGGGIVAAAIGIAISTAEAQVQAPGIFGNLDGIYALSNNGEGIKQGYQNFPTHPGDGGAGFGRAGYMFDSRWDVAIGGGYGNFSEGKRFGTGFDRVSMTEAWFFNADGEIGYNFTGPDYGVRAFGGVRYQRWRHEFRFHPDNPLGCCHTDNDTWGVGPRVGVDAALRLGTSDFSLIGGVDAAVLVGRSVSTGGPTVGGGAKTRAYYNVDARLGVDWEFAPLVHLAAGYRADWAHGAFFERDNFHPNRGGHGDRIVHGPFVRVAYNVGASARMPVAPARVATSAPPLQRNFLVFFDFDRSDITAEADRVIVQAANNAKTAAVTRITLTGHADRSGPAAYNQRLSERRADVVKARLVREGIPASQIVTIGRGETQPLVPTADGVREPQNRRVEIVL